MKMSKIILRGAIFYDLVGSVKGRWTRAPWRIEFIIWTPPSSFFSFPKSREIFSSYHLYPKARFWHPVEDTASPVPIFKWIIGKKILALVNGYLVGEMRNVPILGKHIVRTSHPLYWNKIPTFSKLSTIRRLKFHQIPLKVGKFRFFVKKVLNKYNTYTKNTWKCRFSTTYYGFTYSSIR